MTLLLFRPSVGPRVTALVGGVWIPVQVRVNSVWRSDVLTVV